MNDKSRFGFLLRSDEREALEHLARLADRSQGSTLRCLIREEARRCGLWPAGRYPPLLADYHRDQVGREVRQLATTPPQCSVTTLLPTRSGSD